MAGRANSSASNVPHSDNFTRFYTLSKSLPDVTGIPQSTVKGYALVRISSQPTSNGQAVPSISDMFVALKLRVNRLDRRPSLNSVPFHDVYLIELQQEKQSCEKSTLHWTSEVTSALRRVTEIGGEASVLGVW